MAKRFLLYLVLGTIIFDVFITFAQWRGFHARRPDTKSHPVSNVVMTALTWGYAVEKRVS
jgi:hypothetical protein